MKTKTVHRCSECGCETPRWLGRCPECDSWGTLSEAAPVSLPSTARVAIDGPVPIGDVDAGTAAPMPTGIAELDRVLQGGLVAGSVTLLAGEPGMGKSTLLLQALGRLAAGGTRCLLVTAEESCAQVKLRAERVGAVHRDLLVIAETSLPHVLAHADSTAPRLLAVDSIQTVVDPDLPGAPGSVTQVRDGAYRLVQHAKEHGRATVLVGHVTKEGTLAGPRVLEHVVDTVLSFDGDRGHSLRALHALKHRYGGTEEVGLFEMTERGLVDVPDASARFLVDRRPGVPGSAVAAVLEGARPILVEVQALSMTTAAAMPRRSAAGMESGRLAMLLAVLEQHAGVKSTGADVYASVAGGLRITERGLDLALALAVAGAQLSHVTTRDTVAIGELGLGGEVRSVPQLERRLTEAARLGFGRAVIPKGVRSTARIDGMEMIEVASVRDAIDAALIPAG
ncbi:MAG TPA: DNA repair protein RadA [Acidimicrobiia bacterium]|nr:DNA repair protein RadA [Acidimicrobiia bacterium]